MKKSYGGAGKSIKKIGHELQEKMEVIKSKYDKLDAKTKKKILAGIAGVAALVIGGAVAKKAMGKRK
ncbi:MAG: hypothetical protein AAB358_03405 [Patescibacteria group bacterium]